MSMINKEISDFRTYAYHENEFRFVSKEDILGKWSVFFFYPADFTFVCPTELEDLADKYEQFRAIGCEVYSVSTDTHFVHKAWHDASDRIKKINYPMLADPTHSISKDVFPAHKLKVIFMIGIGAKIGNLLIDHRHTYFLHKSC